MAKKKAKKAKATPQTNLVKNYDGSTQLPSIIQEMFVSNLLEGIPTGEAYTKAGFKSKSPTAHGIRLAKMGKTQARLAYRRKELQKMTGIDAAKVVNELALLAMSNMQDFVYTDKAGNFFFTDWKALSRQQLAAVESIKITTTTTKSKRGNEYTTKNVSFKLHNKTTALELLGRHLGVFEIDNNQRSPKTVICFKDSSGKPILSNIIDVEPEAQDG